MIELHRLGHPDEPLHLNPDLVVSMEANPDTVLTLVTGVKVVVHESPRQVLTAVRLWQSSVLACVPQGAGSAAGRTTRSGGPGAVVALGEHERHGHPRLV